MIKIRRYEIILTIIWLIAINLHRFYDATGIRADIYLFHDNEKNLDGMFVSNILYQIGMHLSRLVPTFILAFRFHHIFFFTIFIYLMFDFIAYLLFFGQGTNIYVIIISVIFLIIYQWKRNKKTSGIFS